MLKVSCIFFLTIVCVNTEAEKRRVCIVGAGVSGLIATKYFSEYPNEFEPVVFEKNSDVGGLWIYTDSTTVDEHGLPVHSSMYKNLRTTTIKEAMTLVDYPHFGGEESNGQCLKHEVVLEYLRNYTDHFKLRRFIQFNTNVEKVQALPQLKWHTVTRNLNTFVTSNTTCDIMMLCNGQNVKGYIPKISGIKSFAGRVLHSHVYREPEAFANQTVVVLGASISGNDISVDISSVARKIYLSHRHDRLPGAFPSNLEQVPGVVAAEDGQLVLSNGTRIRADALIYCTGYRYEFQFLDKSSDIVVEDGKYVRPVYKHMINVERPSMAIIGLPARPYHFRVVPAQVNYFIAVLRGKLRLPSREEMLIEAELPVNASSGKVHIPSSHDFFKYFDELVRPLGGKRLPWWIFPYTDKYAEVSRTDPGHCKDRRVVINEDDRTIEFV